MEQAEGSIIRKMETAGIMRFVINGDRNSIALESFSTLWTIVLIATLAQQVVEYYNVKVAA